MPYDPFVFSLWAKELGYQSEVFVEVSNAQLNTRYGVNITPPAGWEAIIPHKFTIALPLSNERGTPRSPVSRLATSATAYGTVVSYTVPASPARFELQEISLNSDNFSRTNWRVTIGGTEQFTDLVILSALSLPFRLTYLGGAEQVLVEAASTDGTAIVANASITGRLFYPYEWQIWVYKKGLASEEHTAYLTDDIIKDGVGSWVYVTRGMPLRVEVEKLYGRAGDHILIYAWVVKVQDALRLEEIKRQAVARGIQETLPFSPTTGMPIRVG